MGTRHWRVRAGMHAEAMMMEGCGLLFRALCGGLAGGSAVAFLAGCTLIFDAPPEAVANDASAKVMSDLASMEQNASAAISGKLKEAGVTVAEAARDPAAAAGGAMNAALSDIERSAMGIARDEAGPLASMNVPGLPGNTTANGKNMIALSFERVDADMPQLAVQGLDGAVVLIDGERAGLGGVTRAGRIGLVAAGRHHLRVECPRAPPFSADFKAEKGDRIVLRGQCGTPPGAVAGAVQTPAAGGRVASAPPAPGANVARPAPTLRFEKSGDEKSGDGAPPRLVLRGTGKLAVFLDGERVGPGGGDGVPIQVGQHNLRAFHPAGSPFSADFPAENGDRIILCGDCAPDGEARALLSGGGAPLIDKSRDAAPLASHAAARETAPLPRNGGKTPTLTFDRINVEAAQLAIRGMGNATVVIDGERFAPDGIMGVDRLIPIQPGHHSLKVIFPQGSPFTADFDIEAGERATLHGE
jgi:hypothetical protein